MSRVLVEGGSYIFPQPLNNEQKKVTPINSDGKEFHPKYGDSKESKYYNEIADGYRPDELVTSSIVSTEHGALLKIVDGYLPPSQKGEAPKIETPKLPGGSIPYEIDAVVPSTHVFRNTFGATGHDTVEDFNRSGSYGSHWADSPNLKVGAEWRRRMGIVESSSHLSQPYISLGDKGGFGFPGLAYDSGVGKYSRSAGYRQDGINEIGYAAVLLGHNMDALPSKPGDFFFMTVNAGFRDRPGDLVAVRNNSSEKLRRPHYEVLTEVNQTLPLFKEILPEKDVKKLEALDDSHDWWNYGRAAHPLAYLSLTDSVDQAVMFEAIDASLDRIGLVKDPNLERFYKNTKQQLEEAKSDENVYLQLLFSLSQWSSSDVMSPLKDMVRSIRFDSKDYKENYDKRIKSVRSVDVAFASASDSINY